MHDFILFGSMFAFMGLCTTEREHDRIALHVRILEHVPIPEHVHILQHAPLPRIRAAPRGTNLWVFINTMAPARDV